MRTFLLAAGAAALAGCATVPTGPNVMVLPGTGKTFDQFRVDEMECRHYAVSYTHLTLPTILLV